jgi:hypothetical protein
VGLSADGGVADDSLHHASLAASLISHMQTLPPGAVMAVQGPWGRGKTDVVRRVYDAVAADDGPQPLWLNPWQYGTPNLIAPLVVDLTGRLQQKQPHPSRTLRRAVTTLLRAGNAIAFKAASVVVPFGSVIEAASSPIDDFLTDLFEPHVNAEAVDLDPVAKMADRFRELVDEYLRELGPGGGRLVLCVDDIDRCLPDHQIAMLEAIYFLTSARAEVTFLVAIDPTLVQQAAVTHYRTADFDTHQYLDKLFDLRVNLPALRGADLTSLIQDQLDRSVVSDGHAVTVAAVLESGLGLGPDDLGDILAGLLFLPELTNPRLITRLVSRLHLLAGRAAAPADPRLGHALVAWCTVAERWPAVRTLMQALEHEEDWEFRLRAFACHYRPEGGDSDDNSERRQWLDQHANIALRLPAPGRSPDVGDFLEYIAKMGNLLPEAEQMLLRAGL